jgi:hypothetical protein
MALLDDIELRPQHFIVGFFLKTEFLKVGEHYGEFGLHFATQSIRVARINTVLNRHVRDYVVFQHWDFTLPRELSHIQVHKDIEQTLNVILWAGTDFL